jgi:hypothetical protein
LPGRQASPDRAPGSQGPASRPGRLLQGTVVFLCLLKLWSVHDQLLAAITTARIDDRLFVNLARYLLAGEWLGPYDQFTLIKGPFYSMWIAATYLAGVPLLLAQQLLYIAACALLAVALRPLVPSPGLRAVLFAVLLWNPMTYTSVQAMRVVREGIYPALGILVTACAVALLGRAERPLGRVLPWAVGLGLALGAFWLTREEGPWILPLVVPVVALAAFRGRRPAGRRAPYSSWRRPALIAALPVLVAAAAYHTVAAQPGALRGLHRGRDDVPLLHRRLRRVDPGAGRGLASAGAGVARGPGEALSAVAGAGRAPPPPRGPGGP